MRRLWAFWLVVGMGFLGACGSDTAADGLLPTTAAVAAAPTLTPSPLPPTNTPVPTPTATVTPTPTSVVQFVPSDTPAPPPPTPTPTPSTLTIEGPVAGTVGMNEVDVAVLPVTAGEPVYVLGRPDPDLDLGMAVYDRDITTLALETRRDPAVVLGEYEPERLWDGSQPGYPELMVYTPRTDGNQTLVVGGADGTAGDYRLYLLEPVTDTVNTAVAGAVVLAPGETKSYAATAQDGSPIAVFADPLDQGDIRVVFKIASTGAVLFTADFGGPGVHESAFVQPQGSNTYTIEISETAGRPTTLNLIVANPTDPFD